MRESIDELRAQMLMLHEDVLARFALLDEHLGRKPRLAGGHLRPIPRKTGRDDPAAAAEQRPRQRA